MSHESTSANRQPNRLIAEKSPYLLQHAYNPVDWYPWGPEAFARARQEIRPIFLSIGYSTCHWCHVMAHESFEDAEVARQINDAFVAIKVDREERPDVDAVYMAVCQMMTGGGGWPLTIIMTPDKKPFFAATYIPKWGRLGNLGLLELIPRLRQMWVFQRGEALSTASQVVAALQRLPQEAGGPDLGADVLARAYDQLASRFDEYQGGFGPAPKFPIPHDLLFLLRYWQRSGSTHALAMVEKTLQAMAGGGIHDHVGFGFHRYATDSQWRVPHFEKMLYDQAMLALAYVEAYQATGKETYGETARGILTYVQRDLAAPESAFYAAEDADSEGEEGKFYVWRVEEIRQVLEAAEADLAIRAFDVEQRGNFAEEATGRRTGANILHLSQPVDVLAAELQVAEGVLRARLEGVRQKLFAARVQRVRPHRDEKILADWNGLLIAALARAAQALGEPAYATAAQGAADFILGRLRSPEGRLWHRYRDGEAAITGNLDDYAFLVWGLSELYEAVFDTRYLEAALALNATMLQHFWDDARGGLYFTPDDGEELLSRRKEIYDGAVPSGNSVAMLNLLRLARLTGDIALEERAAQIGRAFSRTVAQQPAGYTQLMLAVDFALGPTCEVVVAGPGAASDTQAMLRALQTAYEPRKVVLFRPTDEETPAITRLAPFTQHQTSLAGRATAYVCRNFTCQEPTADVARMLALLRG